LQFLGRSKFSRTACSVKPVLSFYVLENGRYSFQNQAEIDNCLVGAVQPGAVRAADRKNTLDNEESVPSISEDRAGVGKALPDFEIWYNLNVPTRVFDCHSLFARGCPETHHIMKTKNELVSHVNDDKCQLLYDQMYSGWRGTQTLIPRT